jgi:hypothetical protein
MASRFESARREITAAHGGVWRNGLWDLAADKVRVKKALVDRWAEVVNLYGGEALLFGRRYWGRAGIGSAGPAAAAAGSIDLEAAAARGGGARPGQQPWLCMGGDGAQGDSSSSGGGGGVFIRGSVPLFDPCTTTTTTAATTIPTGTATAGEQQQQQQQQQDPTGQRGAGAGTGTGPGLQPTPPPWLGEMADLAAGQDLLADMDFSIFWDESADWIMPDVLLQ